MKILKIILFSIIGIIALVLIVALFVEKDYAVVRQVVINKSKTEVFEFTKYLKNQNQYSVWASADPNMKKDFRGTDGEVGFVSAWDSEKKDVGKGEQEIMKIVDGERIDYELRFIEPFEAKDLAYMTFEATGDSTTLVKWGFNGHMNYPMNMTLLFMDFDAMLGKDLEEGLQNLKVLLEKE
jgi:hypothetical protein